MLHVKFRPVSCKALLLAAAAVLPCSEAFAADAPAAAGQSAGGDIVVTAQKRSENVQNVPIAMNVLSADQLKNQGIVSLDKLAFATPEISAQPYTVIPNVLFIYMRGMGLADPGQTTRDGSIGVYENGIYNARPTPLVFELSDPERVEVLRGPQGTLYGRNTTGGAINVISRAPTGKFDLRETVSYGSYNQYSTVTHIDLPEFANISAKFSFVKSGIDGWGKNPASPTPSIKHNDFYMSSHLGGRLALRWQPSSNVTVDYSLEAGLLKGTPPLYQGKDYVGMEVFPGVPYTFKLDHGYRSIYLPVSKEKILNNALTAEWRVSDSLTLRSLTSFLHTNNRSFADTSDVIGPTAIAIPGQIVSDQISQEFQAIGDLLDRRVKYVLGLYYYREKVHHLEAFDFYAPGGIGNDLYDIHNLAKSYAAYGQVTITPPILQDRMELTLGLRYTMDRRFATRSQTFNGFQFEFDVPNKQRSNRLNPQATLNYHWTKNLSTYVKYATGYRSGGVGETGPDFTIGFGPESVKDYELGLKSQLFDRHLVFNVAAFYNDYRNMQLDLTLDPANPTFTTTSNVGKAHIEGVEVDSTIVVNRDLRFNFSYAYLKGKVTSVPVGGVNQANLFVIPHAPRDSINLSADWTAARFGDNSVAFHLDYAYKGRTFNSPSAGPAVPGSIGYSQAPYSTVNGRLIFLHDAPNRSYSVSLYVTNLLNDRSPIATIANGAQTTSFTTHGSIFNPPRMVGIEASLKL